jgi:hypothetical protein
MATGRINSGFWVGSTPIIRSKIRKTRRLCGFRVFALSDSKNPVFMRTAGFGKQERQKAKREFNKQNDK